MSVRSHVYHTSLLTASKKKRVSLSSHILLMKLSVLRRNHEAQPMRMGGWVRAASEGNQPVVGVLLCTSLSNRHLGSTLYCT